MAVPAYTTDLVRIVDFDADSPTVEEPSTWAAGRSPVIDTDFPIQGSNHGSLTHNTTGKGGMVATGTSRTWTTGHYLFGWLIWLAPGSIATQANGGLAMIAGSSLSAYRVWYVGGSDFGSYPYGGWQNFAVDPTITPDETSGSPTGYYAVGGGANVLSKVAKGNPFGMDVFRYGRGEARIAGGQSGNYATFSGLAAINDDNNNRWGLFQKIDGGFKFKGLLYLGYGTLTEFTDANKSIVIDKTEFVQSDFNRIEFHNASSIVNWLNISFTALGTTSKGQLEMIDNCTLNDIGGVFTDMDSFIYLSNATLNSKTFRRCGLVTQGGASFIDCSFEQPSGAVGILVDSLSNLTGCKFTSKGTGHAIELDTPGTYTLASAVFTGFGANDTTDAAIYNNSGGLVTINISGGASPTVRNGSGASTVINNAVSLTISAPVSLVGAEVRIYDLDDSPAGSLGTELSGVESHNAANYIYSGSGGNVIYIQIMLSGYVEFGQEVTMPSTDGSFYALLKKDLNA